jgi:hypothetical protein
MQEILRLSQTAKKTKLPDEESSRPLLAAGCCIDFHPVRAYSLVLSDGEGRIRIFFLTGGGHGRPTAVLLSACLYSFSVYVDQPKDISSLC